MFGLKSLALAIAVLLTLYNNLINLLPQALHDQVFVPVNLAALVVLMAWARWRGLSWEELGFATERVRVGLKWGLGLGLALPTPLFIGLVLPESLGAMADPRDYSNVSTVALAYQALFRIPLGTALFEEAAFRGVLFGAWVREAGTRAAVIGSSLAFGLWHITPTWELMSGSGFFPNAALLWLAIAGGVLATVVGGLFFAWLRLRTGAVYGPVLTHWLVNALGAVASFTVGR
jgi:membrane protease YdiL (CAAX protease family)